MKCVQLGDSLEKATGCIRKLVQPVAGFSHNIGQMILALLMFLVFADVALRYFFNKPILGSFDLTELMMGILVASSLAYCALQNGNIKTEVLVERLPPKIQAIIDTITSFLSLVFLSLITWRTFIEAKSVFDSRLTSAVLLIPVYPFVTIVAICSLLLSIVLLVDFLTFLWRSLKR